MDLCRSLRRRAAGEVLAEIRCPFANSEFAYHVRRNYADVVLNLQMTGPVQARSSFLSS